MYDTYPLTCCKAHVNSVHRLFFRGFLLLSSRTMKLLKKANDAADSIKDAAEDIAGLTPLLAVTLAAILAVAVVGLTVGMIALGRTRDA